MVPYLYVNITACCCYMLFLVAFLASKKNTGIRGFIVVLTGFFIWSLGSVLMRLEVWPGLNFWFYVSLLALFSEGWLVYLFVCNYAGERRRLPMLLWTLSTVVILILSAFGLFLKPPVSAMTPEGKVYIYSMTAAVAVPYLFLMAEVAAIVMVFRRMIRRSGGRVPGIRAVIFGCIIIGIGNIVQILPGNVFPWDQVSGVIFAALLAVGLYRKRMFSMTLVVSRKVIKLITLIVSVCFISTMIDPIRDLLEKLKIENENVNLVIMVLIFAGFLFLLFKVMDRLTVVLFNLENQQARLLASFSEQASASLNTRDIAAALIRTISEGIMPRRVMVLVKSEDQYSVVGDSVELGDKSLRISADSPVVSELCKNNGCLVMEEFRSSTMYHSLWKEEKNFFLIHEIGCISAIMKEKEVIGLVLLGNKEKRSKFSNAEIGFLSTVNSIAAMAFENARLYEAMYREARVDSLTGVFNYRAFKEACEVNFRKYGKEALALITFDLDDFNLYNQLYGSLEGDEMLKLIAGIARAMVGKKGEVFRTAGNVFSILLPRTDGRQAKMLMEELSERIYRINGTPERKKFKPLSVSAGICVAPFDAATLGELIDHAGLAVFSAKNTGKARTVVVQSGVAVQKTLRETVYSIVERKDIAFDNNETVVSALTCAIDAKDHYTCQHSRNVAEYGSILAVAYGLGEDEVRLIYRAGLLHDIGKISIPETILNKPTRLTDEEYDVIKGHVDGSIDMIRHLPAMDYLIPAVVGHHERWDGRGYPKGTAGNEIPLPARCLALADTFDAMTSNRPYRKGMPLEFAIDQIEKNAGTQFDPDLAACFVRLLKEGSLTINEMD